MLRWLCFLPLAHAVDIAWDWQADSADYAVRTKEEVSKVLLTYSPPELLERANQVRRERAQQVLARVHRGEQRQARWLPSLKGMKLKEVAFPDRGAAIALYLGHDASIAVSRDGRVLCVLELERFFKERYFRYPLQEKDFVGSLGLAMNVVRERCPDFPKRFRHGILVNDHVAHWSSHSSVPLLVEEFYPVETWRWVDHHESHALLAFYASPFRSALIVTYDGGGNDGCFNAYVGSSQGVERIAQLDYNFGELYLYLGIFLSEVSAQHKEVCRQWQAGTVLHWHDLPEVPLGAAGRLMGYSAAALPDPELTEFIEELFEASGMMFGAALDVFGGVPFHRRAFNRLDVDMEVPGKLLRAGCGSLESQRKLAASIQVAMESVATSIIWSLVQHVGPENIEGLALSGGCALSIRVNQLLYDRLSEVGLGFYVPPAPNDGGLTVGGLWSATPPRVRQPLQYMGFELFDIDNLEKLARQRQALRLSELGGVAYLAELLSGQVRAPQQGNASAQQRPIVAVVRGRSEFGPRALGHRSLLAVASDARVPERMNRLKQRQWYRPVAPMIAEDAMEEVFGRKVPSPYMTMAPLVKPEVRARFPALAHFDGTARHQSVSKDDEPFIYALLMAVGKLTGLAALINTSFNTKGRPIVNTVRESLQMLDELQDLDFLLVEDWLFLKRPKA